MNQNSSRIVDGDLTPRKPYITAIKQQPITVSHKPYTPKPFDRLHDAGTARATVAVSNESPNGTTEDGYALKHQHQTVVQQHVAYWDRDNDSIIWPHDTYIGCRDYGWGILLSLIATLFINLGLSYPTCPSILPDPFFRIYIDRLYKAKHGSDSMTYDNQGRFRPQQFEDIFAKYDRGNKGGLDAGDVWIFWKQQRMVFDFFGWTACALEWIATYLLIWPEDGVMKKEDVRGIYDGSIFFKRAEETRQRRARAANPQSRTSQGLVAKAKKLF
ncbi:MAG: hypothetical protein L6R40_000862 [Gallowayella cf. fulva]|nr:MAG: hypothetical protein L6R40_000862 [Xanthomendoza cf. fulva]